MKIFIKITIPIIIIAFLFFGAVQMGWLTLASPDDSAGFAEEYFDGEHDVGGSVNLVFEQEVAVEPVDLGLLGATVAVSVPRVLLAGSTLYATAFLENAALGLECELTWFIGGEAVESLQITTGRVIPEFAFDFEYSYSMPESADVTVGVEVRYLGMADLAEGEESGVLAVFCEEIVRVENYGREHWTELYLESVLDKVSSSYLGDYTYEWALENDLDDFEKEVWVNHMGFRSRTEYLIWVNLAYQRVNIFELSDEGYWELIRTCIVGTGRSNRGTPVGEWYITGKQTGGWNLTSYVVAPVVNFISDSDFAFHSRPYFPDSDELYDDRIGFPISMGCVRMYDEDIWFIHDNLPFYTTVIVN